MGESVPQESLIDLSGTPQNAINQLGCIAIALHGIAREAGLTRSLCIEQLEPGRPQIGRSLQQPLHPTGSKWGFQKEQAHHVDYGDDATVVFGELAAVAAQARGSIGTVLIPFAFHDVPPGQRIRLLSELRRTFPGASLLLADYILSGVANPTEYLASELEKKVIADQGTPSILTHTQFTLRDLLENVSAAYGSALAVTLCKGRGAVIAHEHWQSEQAALAFLSKAQESLSHLKLPGLKAWAYR